MKYHTLALPYRGSKCGALINTCCLIRQKVELSYTVLAVLHTPLLPSLLYIHICTYLKVTFVYRYIFCNFGILQVLNLLFLLVSEMTSQSFIYSLINEHV